jgi:uncharacterized protein DUF6151
MKDHTTAHPIRCRCGMLQGELHVTPAASHAVCYCSDCQTYAHVLGRAGDVLDSLGGTDVIATLPCNVRFTAGADKLVCLSLSPRGALRWYATCCKTPVANTPRNFRVPYAGVIRSCLEGAGSSVEQTFGPVKMRVNTASVKGRVSTMPVSTLAATVKFLSWLIPARLNGGYRQTPFFDAKGNPVAPVTVISRAERDRARQAALDVQSVRGL